MCTKFILLFSLTLEESSKVVKYHLLQCDIHKVCSQGLRYIQVAICLFFNSVELGLGKINGPWLLSESNKM
jgi:hypothetical protein